jgi:hypothetical protein
MHDDLTNSYRLAQTTHGEVWLATDGSGRYWFRYRHLERHLSTPEFHRFHHAIMAHLGIAAPIDLHLSPLMSGAERVMQPLPTCLSRADIRELRTLLGSAALTICTLSKAYNDVN